MTPAEVRRVRLKNDYQTMVNIRRPWLGWSVVRGELPYVEEYLLDVTLKTIVGPGPSYATNHRISVSLPPTYPQSSAPAIRYLGTPRPFHPNWWPDGRWCYGTWLVYESLGQHVKRMLQTLQFDAQITNVNSPANRAAADWYLARRSSGLFPCDRSELPDPTTSRFRVVADTKKRLVIKE